MELEKFKVFREKAMENISKVIIGKEHIIDKIIVSL